MEPDPEHDHRAEPSWDVFGASVCGAAHERTGLRKQDAWGFRKASSGTPLIVLAVSDGHGSPRCFRSHLGAKFAVRSAVAITKKLLEQRGEHSPSWLNATVRQILPIDIVRRWIRAVKRHSHSHPFSPEEKNQLSLDAQQSENEGGQRELLLAYGATLVLMALTDRFIFYLQLGDGDISVIPGNGGRVTHPLPEDLSYLGNETDSLCSPDAQKLFRYRLQRIYGPAPAAIFISTDGYSKSFNGSDFEKDVKVCFDLLNESLTDFKDNLSMWLDECSRKGSGDDITLAVICRKDALRRSDTP
jgi:hypothetical protein